MRRLLCIRERLVVGSEEEGFQYSYLYTYYNPSTRALEFERTELSFETVPEYTLESGVVLNTYCDGTNSVVVTSNGACGVLETPTPDEACGFETCSVTITDFASTNETSVGADDGTVTVTAESNQESATLVYQITGGATTYTNTTGIFTDIPPLAYTLTVFVSGNPSCSTTYNFQILRYACSVVIDSFTVVPATGVAQENGSITVSVTGAVGTLEYTLYRFNTVYRATQSSNVFSDLPSGTYDVIVEDLGDSGCSTSRSVFVGVETALISIADGFCGIFYLAKNYTPYIAIDQILNVSDERVFHRIEPPAGWETVEINDERSKNHGFKQSFSTDELKFGCDNGRRFLNQAKNERGSDANVKIIFGYYDTDDNFIVIEASNLNFNEYNDDGELISIPLIAQEFDGLLETNYNMEQEIAPDTNVYIPPTVLRETATIDYVKQRLNALLFEEANAPEGNRVGYYIPNWDVKKGFDAALISTYPAQLTYVDPTQEVANQTTSKPIFTAQQRGRYKVRFNIAVQAYLPIVDPTIVGISDPTITSASITIYNHILNASDVNLLSNHLNSSLFTPVPYTVKTITTYNAKSDVDWRAFLRDSIDYDAEPLAVSSDVVHTHVINLESDWLYMPEGTKIMFNCKFQDGAVINRPPDDNYQTLIKGCIFYRDSFATLPFFVTPAFVHSVKSVVLIGDTEPTQLIDENTIPIQVFGDTLDSPSLVKAINLENIYSELIQKVTKVQDINISNLLSEAQRLGERTYLFTEAGIKNSSSFTVPKLKMTLEQFVNNLAVLLNTGMGTEIVPTASITLDSVPPSPFLPTLRIEEMDYFYQDKEVYQLTDISDFERRFDSSFIFSKIEVGFNNYQKARENYGLAAENDIHTKYIYETPITRYNNTLNIVTDWTFSNQLIERARQEGKQNPAGSAMRFDDNIMGVVTTSAYTTYPALFTALKNENEFTIYTLNSSDVTYIPRYMPIVVGDRLTISYGANTQFITVSSVVYDFDGKVIITFPELIKDTSGFNVIPFPITDIGSYVTYTLTTEAAARRVPEAFETFPVQFISGAYDNYSVYNLRFTPKRILLNNSNFFNASFKFKQPYEIIELKTKDNEINFVSQFANNLDPDIGGDTAVRPLLESRSLTIDEGYNGQSPLSCEVVSFKTKLPFSAINFIRKAYRGAITTAEADVNYGYLTVPDPDGGLVKLFPKSLVYNIAQGILSVEGWIVGTAVEPNPANIPHIVDENFDAIVFDGQDDFWVWS